MYIKFFICIKFFCKIPVSSNSITCLTTLLESEVGLLSVLPSLSYKHSQISETLMIKRKNTYLAAFPGALYVHT